MFFPVVFLYGVSKYLFTALALTVVISLFASYFVALTIVPLFCALFIHKPASHEGHDAASSGWFFHFNRAFIGLMTGYDVLLRGALRKPILTTLVLLALFGASLFLYPLLGTSFFPRTDPGQFVINLKAALGTNLELTESKIARVEDWSARKWEPGIWR